MKTEDQPNAKVSDDRTGLDDNMSLSSASEEEGLHAEWPVKRVLAQAKVGGHPKFLVEWEGYSLSDVTWEPAKHLTRALLQEWRLFVQRTGRDMVPQFRISQWRKALDDAIGAKFQKYQAKNRKRALRGKRPRPLQCTLQEWLNSVQGPSEDVSRAIDSQNDGLSSPDDGGIVRTMQDLSEAGTSEHDSENPYQEPGTAEPLSNQEMQTSQKVGDGTEESRNEDDNMDKALVVSTSTDIARSLQVSTARGGSRAAGSIPDMDVEPDTLEAFKECPFFSYSRTIA